MARAAAVGGTDGTRPVLHVFKVSISTPGPFQPAYTWANYLHRQGRLERIISPMPYRRVAEFGIPPEPLLSFTALGAWNTLVHRYGPKRLQEASQPWSLAAFDTFASRFLGEPDAFNGWTGCSLKSIRTAKSRGIPVVLQTGSAHIVAQKRLLDTEADVWGVGEATTHPKVIERALEEYECADAIVVPSPFVRKTFLDEGIEDSKIKLVPWAGLPVYDGQRDYESRSRLAVLYVGALSLRKGTPYLIEAARSLGDIADFRLVGGISQAVLERVSPLPENVTVVGPQRGPDLAREFADADVFVLPSVEDGSAVVILEAMMAGLPVIISEQAGPALIEDGANGYIVPAGDAGAIAEKVRLLASAELRERLGLAARSTALPRTPDVYGTELDELVYGPLIAGAASSA